MDIPIDQLETIWADDETKTENEPTILQEANTSAELPDLINDNLVAKTVAELKAICTVRGVKKSGKKIDIIARLLGQEVVATKKTATKAKTKAKTSQPKILTALAPVSINVKQNKNGDYVHQATGLVVCKETKKVIGKEAEEGYVELTKEDIDLCHKFKLDYEIPDNLGTSAKTADESYAEVEKTISEELEKFILPEEPDEDEDEEEVVKKIETPKETETNDDNASESSGEYEEYTEYIETVVEA